MVDPVETVPSTRGASGAEVAPEHVLSPGDLHALLEIGSDWLWETDGELRFTWLSDSFMVITGVDPAAVLGRFRFDFLKNVLNGGSAAIAHMEALQARLAFRDFVYELKDGGVGCRWVSISGVPRFDADGEFIGYRGVGRNVTGVAGAIENLEKASPRTNKTYAEPMMAGLDAMRDAFCYYDATGTLVLCNEAMLAIYSGLRDVIMPGAKLETLIDAGLARGLFDTQGLTNAQWREIILNRHDDEVHWSAMIRFADGRCVMHREMRGAEGGVVSICTDVTEHESREAELTTVAERNHQLLSDLKRTVDSVAMGIVILDANLNVEIINKAFCTIWKLTSEQARPGVSFRTLLDFDRGEVLVNADDAAWEAYVEGRLAEIRSGDVAPRELGDIHGRSTLYSVTTLSDGKRLVSYYDVTELKHREAEVVIANARSDEAFSTLRIMVDSMPIGIVVVDADLQAEIINRAFYEFWEIDPAGSGVGVSFRDLMEASAQSDTHGYDPETWPDYIEMREAEIRRGNAEPRQLTRSDGRTMICSMTALTGGKRLISYVDVTDMKQREAELADALEKAKLAEAVINSVPNPMFVKDADLNYVMANQAFADLLDTTPDQILGRKDKDIVPPEEIGIFEDSERRVLETGEMHNADAGYVKDGVEGLRIIRKNRVQTSSGKLYLASSIFDVSESKQREKEAETARKHLANVLGSLPAAVMIYDRDDNFVFANTMLQDSLPEMAPNWVPGKPLRQAFAFGQAKGYFRESGDSETDALYDVDAERWLDAMIEHYRAPNAIFERLNPDGRWYQVYNMRTDDGTFIGVRVGITELKSRELALEESMRENEVFRNLIDNVPVSIYAKGSDLKLSYVNKGWCDLTGFSKEEGIGKTDLEVFGADGEAFVDTDLTVLRTGETQETEETVTAADGSLRHQFARKGAMIASDGSLYLIGSTTDITDLKHREVELREARHRAVLADRAKSEFLANMSHEIRTPMNGVLGMAELLAKSELDPKQKTFTDIIVKSGNALLTIINDILDFSKIDAGQLVLDPTPFSLSEAIEDVATLISTRAKEKDLELIVRIEPGLDGLFIGDVGRVRQIVTNLLGNAVKFTDAGHVLVDVTGEPLPEGTRLRVSVTDTGIGIPEEKCRLIFEKFSQVDASSTRRHEGTGLGLAISSRLVELMGGKIGVDSAEGKGSTFWFAITLPSAEHSERKCAMPTDVSGARVLIVDDNAVNRAILTEQMVSWGFDSCAASSGAEGLKVLIAAATYGLPVDCIVLDYQMPGMSGEEMARIIRNSGSLADTPIVMLTSVDHSLTSSGCRDLDIDAHLLKPARSSALLEGLVTAIQRHRARNAPAEEPGIEAAAPAPVIGQQADEIVALPPTPPLRSRTAGAAGESQIDILVAEDNEVNQLVFTQILGETGYSFEIVGNGRLAFDAFTRLNPLMILMDVSMPEMNGHEATAEIRQIEVATGTHVPIVGVTAHALKGDRERCLEAGMDDYLSKPISPKALLEKVERWLENRDEDDRVDMHG